MKKQAFILSALLAGAVAAPAAMADASAMAQLKGCMNCHQIDKKVVGPAFKDVAKKHAGEADAVAHLASKVKNGGVGAWGQIPMPPNNVTEEEAKQLVEWVLSLK